MWWLIGVAALSGIFYIYKLICSRSVTKLQKVDFVKDVIYLIQFPVSPVVRSVSPFALKVESYLRLKKVKYEPVYSFKLGKKGLIPYIELNGEQIPDSNIIIHELERRGITAPDDITCSQKAFNHLVRVATENQTILTLFYWRYGFHMDEFFEKVTHFWPTKRINILLFKYLKPILAKVEGKIVSCLRHSKDEIVQHACEDLKALSTLLGDKSYFNGERLSTIDCTIFGHLVQFVLLPMDMPHKKFIQDECHNLVEFVERVKNELWPDWDKMCHESCMDGKRHKSATDTQPVTQCIQE